MCIIQAFRSHQACDPLVNPGSCDLTADVDFAALKDVAITNGTIAVIVNVTLNSHNTNLKGLIGVY